MGADYIADQAYLPPTAKDNLPHQITHAPTLRDSGIPGYILDQFKGKLGIPLARGDSGAPSVYRAYLPIINRAPELRSLTQQVDPEAITPEECRTLWLRYGPREWDIVVTEDMPIRLIGGIVVFSDQVTSLDAVSSSDYYWRSFEERLRMTTEFMNRFFPFKFEVVIHRQPLISPQPFQEIQDANFIARALTSPDFLEFYRSHSGLPIKRYPELANWEFAYPVYVLIVATDPTIPLSELYNRKVAGGGSGRKFTRSPGGGIAGVATLPLQAINSEHREWTSTVTEHEILHGLGVRHDSSNRNSVMLARGSPPLNQAIITRNNLAGSCSP